MTITERLALIRAGYKRADIDAMIEAEAQQPAEPQDEQHEPEPQPEPEPEPQPEQPAEPEAELAQLRAEIAELRKGIQQRNFQQIAIDSPPRMTAEEALAQGVFGNTPKK